MGLVGDPDGLFQRTSGGLLNLEDDGVIRMPVIVVEDDDPRTVDAIFQLVQDSRGDLNDRFGIGRHRFPGLINPRRRGGVVRGYFTANLCVSPSCCDRPATTGW